MPVPDQDTVVRARPCCTTDPALPEPNTGVELGMPEPPLWWDHPDPICALRSYCAPPRPPRTSQRRSFVRHRPPLPLALSRFNPIHCNASLCLGFSQGPVADSLRVSSPTLNGRQSI